MSEEWPGMGWKTDYGDGEYVSKRVGKNVGDSDKLEIF